MDNLGRKFGLLLIVNLVTLVARFTFESKEEEEDDDQKLTQEKLFKSSLGDFLLN